MSTPISSNASMRATTPAKWFRWLVQLAQAVVIAGGIASGYSLAMTRHASENALHAAEAGPQRGASADQGAPACMPERTAGPAAGR